MGYALTATISSPFDETLRATRAALADQGFGVLTEIDLASTLRAKVGAEIPAQVILGACRPALAHAALQAEPSIGLLLPCNVVVRAMDDATTVVEVLDPTSMVTVTGNDRLAGVADEARGRLTAALHSLTA
jgi:uncharacterized protein (DUF302 family)